MAGINTDSEKVDTTMANERSSQRSPPGSPAFSRNLVNPNIYVEVKNTTTTTTTSPVHNQAQFFRSSANSNNELQQTCSAEFSPRSISSDDSMMNVATSNSSTPDPMTSQGGAGTVDQNRSGNNNSNSNMRKENSSSSLSDAINRASPSTHNRSPASRGASTDDDLEVTVDSEGLDVTGLPSALIVANLPESLFRDPAVKAQFESMYLAVDPEAKFGYFKCFRRARLAFSSPVIATRVRLLSHGSIFCGNSIKCYFHEPAISSSPRQLEPPELEKQFLISPPASPPVGWQQMGEHSPIVGAITPSVLPPGGGPITEEVAEAVQQKLILKKSPAANITGLELMAALAKLVPGEQTEILSPEDGIPGIVIQTCEDDPNRTGKRIPQTRCPERKS